MKRALPFFLVLGLVLSPLLLRGEAVKTLPENYYQGDLSIPEINFDGAQSLSLSEAMQLVVAQGLEMQFARLDYRKKQYDDLIARGIYDTTLGIDATYSHDREERASVILGDTAIDATVDVSLQKKLPTGTTVTATLNGERHTTNSSFTTFPKSYTGYLKFEVDQPLLQNFFGYVDRAQIKQVAINTQKFNYETLDKLEESVAKARSAYWDVVFAYKNLLDRKEDIEKAYEFLKLTEDKMELGLTEKPDQYAAEANVRSRIISVWEAKNDLSEASYALKVLLNTPEVDLIIPTEIPEFRPLQLRFDHEIVKAFERRRDLKAMALSLEDARIEAKVKWNERLPKLDFFFSMAGTSLDENLPDSQGKIWDYDHPQYYAGIEFEFPLENRKARHTYSQARLDYERRIKELQNLQLKVGQELDRSVRRVHVAAERVKQTQKIKELQIKKLEEEESNFNVGRSESKTIIDFQEDVIQASTEATRALVDYEKAVESYYASANILLEKAGLTEQKALEGRQA